MTRKKTKTGYYERLLFVFKNAAAFMPLVMIPFGFLARSGLTDNRYYSGDAVFAFISAAYLVVSVLNFWYVRRLKPSLAGDLAFTAVFHVLTLLFILFISGFLSAFLSVWIVLMISTDIRFGTRGFFASFAGLCMAGIFMLIAHSDIAAGERYEIIQGAIVVGAIGFVIAKIRNITDRERLSLAKTRQEEIYQRERLLALVNSMGDAVVATDEQGVIKVYNSTLLNLLDTNLNLTGKTIDEVLRLHDNNGRSIKITEEAKVRHAVFSRTDLSHKFEDGETIKLYINVAPIQPSYRSHAESGYIFILRDITKEKTLEEERDEFISVVSHELRTPVAIAEGGLSNIVLLQERGAAPEMLKSAAKAAHEQILYLSKLINDLSALSRAERGLGAEIEIVDLNTLLHDLYANYVEQAKTKGLVLNIDVAKLPHVVSSRLYIEEIMQNLLTNAIKYTKQGSITIWGKRESGGVILKITDTGIGISKSDQKHMFEKFYRSEDYRTRESSGTGLGLYVCKKLSEKIGLSLEFTSRLNHGSTFTLTIPAEQIAKLTDGATRAARPGAAEASKPDSKHSGPSN
ncbi:MAG TPA: PAS domain-containing sensor histidine kinase [Candidatus Saccharimonadales bacterium]|nr:PAS domain-containing sensor histidine kinase [Candidatus Saccharimonadales bacterium]